MGGWSIVAHVHLFVQNEMPWTKYVHLQDRTRVTELDSDRLFHTRGNESDGGDGAGRKGSGYIAETTLCAKPKDGTTGERPCQSVRQRETEWS